VVGVDAVQVALLPQTRVLVPEMGAVPEQVERDKPTLPLCETMELVTTTEPPELQAVRMPSKPLKDTVERSTVRVPPLCEMPALEESRITDDVTLTEP
jgi:hypothetical protein